jgi:hypothetical protein
MEEDPTAQDEALEANQAAAGTEETDEVGDGFLYAQGTRGER